MENRELSSKKLLMQSILSHEDFREIEISDDERKLFRVLDKLGEVGVYILENIALPRLQHTQDGQFHISRKSLPESSYPEELRQLSDKQRKLLQQMTSTLRLDMQMIEKVSSQPSGEILQAAWENIGKNGPCKNDGVQFDYVPGGLVVFLNTQDAAEQWLPTKTASGSFFSMARTYKRHGGQVSITNKDLTDVGNRIIYVSTTNRSLQDIEDTVQHEYWHLLHYNYITVFEQQALNTRESYNSTGAQNIFEAIRNELVGYIFSDDKIILDEGRLLSNQYTLNEIIVSIVDDASDRIKLRSQWLQCKKVFTLYEHFNIPSRLALSAILTSQNFDQITKRLLLELRKAVHRDDHEESHNIAA